MSFGSMHDDYLDPDKNLWGDEVPCEMCGHWVDDCICPECPVCGEVGNKKCYSKHKMQVSAEQLKGILDVAGLMEQRAADFETYCQDIGPYEPDEEYERPFKVHCSKCGLVNVKETKFLNVEEGVQGEDICSFVCSCGTEGKSVVLG